jgi:hypothetical protein
VADFNNSTIRKLTPSGTNWIVTTYAGQTNASGSADGTGTNATFSGPDSVAVDGAGNVYVSDTFNYTIRKITPAGMVSTIGGVAGLSANLDATGSRARFSRTEGVAVDSAGNLYVADYDNNSIRKAVPTASLPAPVLHGANLAAGQFSFGITGLPGLRVDIQAVSNLSSTNWQFVGTYVLSGGTNSFIGVSQRQGNQFYRGRVP